jgi:hypothetical protein
MLKNENGRKEGDVKEQEEQDKSKYLETTFYVLDN